MTATVAHVRLETRRMLFCVAGLALIGLASAVSCAPPGTAPEKLGLHCLHLSLGLMAFLAGFSVPVERVRAVVPGSLAILFLILVMMLTVPGFAHRSHGAARWVGRPPVGLQPSAFLLCLWPIALASWAAHDPVRLVQPWALTRLMVLFSLMVAPVLLQPDLGTVAILTGVSGITLFFAGAPISFLRVLVPVSVAALFVALVLFDHVDARLLAFVQGETGFQARAAQEAFAIGGLTGTGPGLGVMKNGWVPEGSTDFILALIAEEWGLVGSLSVWLLFVSFTVFGVRAARASECRYGAILMASATLMISIQAALNMAVVTGAVPPKGLPLPFVSRGGSSILALSCLLGVAIRAAHERRRPHPSPTELTLWTESNVPA